MLEFLICRTDGKWIDLDFDRYPEVFHPSSIAYERIIGWGCHRIRVGTVEISISDEDPGYQISFADGIDPDVAAGIVEEMRQNLEAVTGQRGRVVEL